MSSSLPSPLSTPEEHQLLGGLQFVVLCVVVLACYYGALYISATAVGESTDSIMAPINLVRQVCLGLGTSIMEAIRRRRNRINVGVELADGGYDVIDPDEANNPFNEPAPGVR